MTRWPAMTIDEAHAVMTAPDRIPPETRERLSPLFGRYLSPAG